MGAASVKPLREGFDPDRPNPNPLAGYQADLCLFAAEKIDGYRTQIAKSPVNMKARSGQNYRAAQYAVALPIENADSKQPWWSGQVLWMESTADGGLPHTRPPGYICLPKNIPPASLKTTLLHERVHLHQRRYPDKWVQFVGEKWNMKPWNGTLPKEIEQSRRLNPDLLAIPFFIWKNKWVPLCIFNDPGKPSLSNASTVWYNVDLKTTTQLAPEDWSTFFGKVPDDEHPWEISAYYIADPKLKAPAKDLLMAFVPSLPNTFL